MQQKIFRQLTDVDMKFGNITNEEGQEIELTHSSFGQLLFCSDREVRKTAFHQYYAEFSAHANSLSASLNGSIQKDVYYAKVRN